MTTTFAILLHTKATEKYFLAQTAISMFDDSYPFTDMCFDDRGEDKKRYIYYTISLTLRMFYLSLNTHGVKYARRVQEHLHRVQEYNN